MAKLQKTEMLGVVFTIGVIIGAGILIWLNTKSGKKWLEEL